MWGARPERWRQQGNGEIGQPGDAVATDQPLQLPILQAGLHGWIYRIRWAGLVQQHQDHRFLAKLAETCFQATAAVGSAEIPTDHPAAVEAASQRAQTWRQLKQAPQTSLALSRGGWGVNLPEPACWWPP